MPSKSNKFIYQWVIQRRNGRWEDIKAFPISTDEATLNYELTVFILTEPQYRHRIAQRRIKNPDYRED